MTLRVMRAHRGRSDKRALQGTAAAGRAALSVPEVVLPKAQDRPATAAQFLGNGHVPSTIPGELRKPVALVGARVPPVFGASVPKTAVHKDSQTLTRECEIRLAAQWIISPPSRDLVFPEDHLQP